MSDELHLAAIPLLVSLGLGADELRQLGRNGFVSRELRSHGPVYKLRFRIGGQQRVRVLGYCPERAAAVERELADLQRTRDFGREARRLAGQANKLLRQAKAELVPHVRASGFAFHGLAIRKPRARRTIETSVPPVS